MRALLVLCFLGGFALSPSEGAELSGDFMPRFEEDTRAARFTLGLDLGQFSLTTGNISIVGAGFDLQYRLSDRFAVGAGVGLALTPSGFSFVYTSFGARLFYAFSGSFAQGTQRIVWKDKTVGNIYTAPTSIWGLSAGLEQFLFSGKNGVYPAPGWSAGLYHRRELFGRECGLELKYGRYTSNSSAISAMLFRLSVYLD